MSWNRKNIQRLIILIAALGLWRVRDGNSESGSHINNTDPCSMELRSNELFSGLGARIIL